MPEKPPSPEPPERIDTDELILIVVGAHLRAEKIDRPLGYRLRERILAWIDQHATSAKNNPGIDQPLEPMLCTDLWYLNNEDLTRRPTISIGGPGVNAVSAFMANRLPTAFLVDEVFQVMLDVEYNVLWSTMWGASASGTSSAIDLFVERYMEGFLRRAHGEPLL